MKKEDKTNKEIEELQQQVAELTEALQRERADVINVRRQHETQINMLQSMVKAGVVTELLPVIDNFERALKHVPAELEGNDYVKGVNGVVKQFEKTLEQMGVERIKTVGEVFDPNVHEAVTHDEGDPGINPGQGIEVVYEELQSGYRLGDSVLRPAMVKVKTEAANG